MQTNVTEHIASALFEKALIFIRQAQLVKPTVHHNDLLARCAAHLQVIYNISSLTAERLATQALSEYESRGQSAFVDIDSCTSQSIRVRIPGSDRCLVFSAAGLARIAAAIKPEDRHPASLPMPKHVLWVGVDPCAPQPPH